MFVIMVVVATLLVIAVLGIVVIVCKLRRKLRQTSRYAFHDIISVIRTADSTSTGPCAACQFDVLTLQGSSSNDTTKFRVVYNI